MLNLTLKMKKIKNKNRKMGNTYLSTPITTKTTETLINKDGIFIHSCMQGWRNTMEDSYIMSELSIPQHYILGIFDGHGGDEVAIYVGNNIVRLLERMKGWQIYKKMLLKDNQTPFTDIDKYIKKLLESLCFEIDKEVFDNCKSCHGCGTTGTIVLISPDTYYCVNVGDSRTVLCNKNGNVMPLSYDHKPNNKIEKIRIEKAKGYVSKRNRVDDELALSRAFGDFQFKDGLNNMKKTKVICFPDVTITKRTSQDQYLILACDGIWDVMSNENIYERIKYIGENIENIRIQGEKNKLKEEIFARYQKELDLVDDSYDWSKDDAIVYEENRKNLLIKRDNEINNLPNFKLRLLSDKNEILKFICENLIDGAIESKDNISLIMFKPN